MENKVSWSFKRHCFVSLVITLVTVLADVVTGSAGLLSLVIKMKATDIFDSSGASAIGIIGGADGPTAVFYSGNPLSVLVYSKIGFFFLLLLLFKPTKKYLNIHTKNK